MSIEKTTGSKMWPGPRRLCCLCECPVVDGGVRISEVDMGNLPHRLQNSISSSIHYDIKNSENSWICQFCVWDARQILDNSLENNLAWWPQDNDEYMIYMHHYQKKQLMRCSVQLKKLPECKSELFEEETGVKFDKFSGGEDDLQPSVLYEVQQTVLTVKEEIFEGDENCLGFSNGKTKCEFPIIEKEQITRSKFCISSGILCVYCNKLYNDQKAIWHHMKRVHSKVVIKCTYNKCASYFKTESERDEHRLKVHAGKYYKACPFCNLAVDGLSQHMRVKHPSAIRCNSHFCVKYFKSEAEMLKHKQDKHEKVTKVRKKETCLYCGKIYYLYRLVAHCKSKHKDIFIRCSVKKCIQIFKSQEDLDLHFKCVHEKKELAKTLKCHFCTFKAETKAILGQHIIRLHLFQELVICPKCPKVFRGKINLTSHLKSVHKAEKNCPHCSKTLKAGLKGHVGIDYCETCGKKFECVGQKQRHKLECIKPTYECAACHPFKNKFRSKCQLKYHLNKYHKESAERKWKNIQHQHSGIKCEKCKIHFGKKSGLYVHNNNYHPKTERPKLTCDLCKKQCMTRTRIEQHMEFYHGCKRKEFKCHKCPESFSFKQQLAFHLNRRHSSDGALAECEKCGRIMVSSCLSEHVRNFH